MRYQVGRWPDRLTAAGLMMAAALGWPAGPAEAQQADTGDSRVVERFAFDAADTNGDGMVSKAELARDAARGFAALDRDGSETLQPDELAPHDPAQFKRVDANGDGVLTFTEVMNNKTRALGDGDKNRDGGLSFEEMVTIVEDEMGGAS